MSLNFIPIGECEKGPGHSVADWSHFLPACTCDVCDSTCPCLFGQAPFYDADRRLLSLLEGSESNCIYECGRRCACNKLTCRHRVTQRGVTFKLRICDSNTDKGLGVHAAEQIPAASFVSEFVGELIGTEEFERRQQMRNNEQHVYAMQVREQLADGRQLLSIIDPTYKGNLSRLINHSCAPNLVRVLVRHDRNVPRVAFFSLRTIDVGEELSYAYDNRHQSTVERRDANNLKLCLCNANNCVGTLASDLSSI